MSKLKMKWPYSYEDKRSWKYINCIITGKGGKRFVKKWVLNPNFKYKDLDPTYRKEFDKDIDYEC